MARRRATSDDQERERARTIYRKINPRVHGSEDFLALSSAPSGRALWLFLLSCRELTRIPGVVLAGPLALAESIEWDPADFDRCMGEIVGRGMARIDRRARVLWLTHAHIQDENRPENPNQVIGWRTTWDLIPECALKVEIWTALDEWINTGDFPASIVEAFQEACPKPREHGSGNGSDNGSRNRYRNQESGVRNQESGARREERAPDRTPEPLPDATEPTPPEAPQRSPEPPTPPSQRREPANAPTGQREGSGAKAEGASMPAVPTDPPARQALSDDSFGAEEAIVLYNEHRPPGLPAYERDPHTHGQLVRDIVEVIRADRRVEREERAAGRDLERPGLNTAEGWIAFCERMRLAKPLADFTPRPTLGAWVGGASGARMRAKLWSRGYDEKRGAPVSAATEAADQTAAAARAMRERQVVAPEKKRAPPPPREALGALANRLRPREASAGPTREVTSDGSTNTAP